MHFQYRAGNDSRKGSHRWSEFRSSCYDNSILEKLKRKIEIRMGEKKKENVNPRSRVEQAADYTGTRVEVGEECRKHRLDRRM